MKVDHTCVVIIITVILPQWLSLTQKPFFGVCVLLEREQRQQYLTAALVREGCVCVCVCVCVCRGVESREHAETTGCCVDVENDLVVGV